MTSAACLYPGSFTLSWTSDVFLPVYVHLRRAELSACPPTQGDSPEFITKLHLFGIPSGSQFLFCLLAI